MTNMPPNAQILKQLPHRREEAWKWTDLRGAVKGGESGLTSTGLPKFTAPDGISITESDGDGSDTPMGAVAKTFGGKVWTVAVPEGFSSDTPLVIEGLSRGHIRLQIDIAKGASLDIVEHHSGDPGAFVNIDMRVNLKAGARLSRTIVHNDPEDCVRVATTHVTAWEKALVNQHTLSFGGAMSRLETRLAGMGKNIEANIHGAYLLSGKRHTDMTSYIDLAATDALVRQSVKGVVTDKARGVFQGKFHVRRPAQHTDAEMRHDALMLSDTAEVRAKPELEIYADDVACAHGNTIGQLDVSALFYMRQRGIPLRQARALLTEAFVASAFDDIADEGLKDSLLTKVRDWLELQI